ncbi:hypothetical protein [Vallitalea okinawensis]|uniref:hypothetical protein n=1 Tax=Vallitalea okinawensis TaxID=2078660 RepID=UPI000CFBE1D7|nr:hypothetical protein [Vallitalea okinawensis]
MSKLLTIYNVMKEMKKAEVRKGTFDLEVSSDGENIVKLSNDFEFDMDFDDESKGGFRSHMKMDMGHGPRHFHHQQFNMKQMDDIPEELKESIRKHEEKLEELGFSKEEVNEMKTAHMEMMKSMHMSKLDRAMFMIKLLDQTTLIENDDKKVLSLDIQESDLPEEFKVIMDHKKKHMQFKKKCMEKVKENDLDFEPCHTFKNEQFKKRYEVMKEIHSSVEKAGLTLETLQPENLNIKLEINDKNQIEKAISTINLVDENGKNIIIKAQKSSINI